MLKLILSLDYELLGNGGGNVRSMLVQPTDRIMDICDAHGAKLTIMFEVAEYCAMKDAAEKNLLPYDYNPAELMADQAKEAVRRGHDVQLHIHPQWIGAQFRDGVWHLNMQHYRIADLPGGYGSREDPFSVLGALNLGKKTLESLLKPVNPNYECRVFRAGGFYAQPSKLVIQAMREIGLWADSSVVRGLHTARPWEVDYRNAEKASGWWWTTCNDVSLRGAKNEGVLEFPVYSLMAPYYRNFTLSKLKCTLKRRALEKQDPHRQVNGRESTPNIWSIFFRMFETHIHSYDFCKLSSSEMVETLIKEEHAESLVLIGHSKDFYNDDNFDRFLKEVKKFQWVSFSSFHDVASSAYLQ